jgi:hypothetical protein
MDNFEQRPEQLKIYSLTEVPAIQESRNQMIVRRDQVKDFVEDMGAGTFFAKLII